MDTAQWPQDMGMSKSSIEAIMVPPTCTSTRPQLMERRPRPPREHALNCPRCHSSNTKFCYYNNYSLSQPRYFCKTCRRYWTEGGSLRNVPVGGGSRKNKRPSKRPLDLPHASTPTPSTAQMSRFDLAFQTQMGSHFSSAANPAPLISMAPEQDNAYSGLALQDLRTNSIAFQVGGIEEDGGYNCNFQEGGRVLFPFEDLRRRDADVDQTRAPGADPLFWNSVMGGGGTSW